MRYPEWHGMRGNLTSLQLGGVSYGHRKFAPRRDSIEEYGLLRLAMIDAKHCNAIASRVDSEQVL